MSQQQLDSIIHDVQTCFGAWNAETSLQQMRDDWDNVFAKVESRIGATRRNVLMNKVPAEHVSAPGAATDRAILYLHGGGYAFGSPRSHRDLAEHLSDAAGAQVFTLHYRLAPEHPYPAAVDDATDAYRWLLEQGYKPGRIAISGDSAGGGLTFATLLSLKNKRLPMPACATPLSPWVDLENVGETMTSRDAEDPIVHKPMVDQLARMYLPEGSLRQPGVSPLHGDLSGLPPLLIQVGSRETLLDNSERIAARARSQGVDVQLDVWQGQIHVWHIFASRLDEGVEAIQKLGEFIRRHTGEPL
ncbi:MAG: alpha/beta hydrolase [Panacagrimonas sp.]